MAATRKKSCQESIVRKGRTGTAMGSTIDDCTHFFSSPPFIALHSNLDSTNIPSSDRAYCIER